MITYDVNTEDAAGRKRLRQIAKKCVDYEAVVFTFDIPPRAEVADVEAHLLTTNEEKRWIFEHTGIDYLIECPFTQEIMHMPPEEFVRWMVEALHVKCFVVGKDFHFGYQRKITSFISTRS